MASIQVELRVEMEDGRTFDVVADQRDAARWEVQDFGTPFNRMQERLMVCLRFLAWSALTRRQMITGMTWEQFDAACVEASDPVDDEEHQGVEEVADGTDPGRPGPSAAI